MFASSFTWKSLVIVKKTKLKTKMRSINFISTKSMKATSTVEVGNPFESDVSSIDRGGKYSVYMKFKNRDN